MPVECQSYAQVRSAIATVCHAGFGPCAALEAFHALHDELFDPLTREIVLAWNPKHLNQRPATVKALEVLKTTP